MRALRLSLVGAVILMLIGSVGGTTLGQAEDGQTTASGPFSASTVDYLAVDDMNWVPGPPYGHLDDWGLVLDVDASDPRFSGTWTMVQNGHGFGEPGTAESFSVYTGRARLENDGGTWTGTIENFRSEAYERMRLVVEGEGGYAGYAAIIDQAEEFGEFQGIVFEGGLPTMPDPIEPSVD